MSNSNLVAEALNSEMLNASTRSRRKVSKSDYFSEWSFKEEISHDEQVDLLESCLSQVKQVIESISPKSQSDDNERFSNVVTGFIDYLNANFNLQQTEEFEPVECLQANKALAEDEIEVAFDKVMKQQGANLPKRAGKQPKRTERLWNGFQTNPRRVKSVEFLASHFPGENSKEKQDNLRTAISKTNNSFKDLGLDIEIYHFSGYGIRRVKRTEVVAFFP